MFKLKINLYNKSDRYTKEIPVTIRSETIETHTQFPKIAEKIVTFEYDYSKEYEIESQGKVNTRFNYSYSEYYIKSGDAGNQKLYAKLKRWQRFILSFIKKDSIFHKHPFKFAFLIVNIIGFIPVWVPFLSSDHAQYNQAQIPNSQIILQDTIKGNDSLQLGQADTLQIKEQVK